MKGRIAICLGFATALGVTACDMQSREVTMRIDHYQQPCTDAEPGFCLRVLESSDPDVREADRIEGFEHRWGHVYEVVVLVTETADGALEYDLVDVISDDEVEDDPQFEIEFAPEFVQRVEPSEFRLVSDTTAYCASREVCEAVGQALVAGESFSAVLSHNPSESGTFIAHAVTLPE